MLPTLLCPNRPPTCTLLTSNLTLTCRRQALKQAEKTAQNALVPAQDLQKDLQVRAKKVSNALIKFTSQRQIHVEKTIGALQKVSPTPILYLQNSSFPSPSTSSRPPSPSSSCSSSETSYSFTTTPSSSHLSLAPRVTFTRCSTASSAGHLGRL
jgi:hypothetical protein